VQASAVALVLSSTASHAYWNFLLKRAGGSDVVLGLSKVAEAILFAPIFVWLMLVRYPDHPAMWGWILVAALLAMANYLAVSKAYSLGDLSLVYPISRAGILLFLPAMGFLAFGERPSPLGWLALASIVAGILVLQLPAFSRQALAAFFPQLSSRAVVFALLAALAAAGYTVWDKRALRELPAFTYFYAYTALVAAAYVVMIAHGRPRAEIAQSWREHRSAIVQIGVFNTGTYLLVLIALRGETSSYVIAMRQLSIVWGALLGRSLLNEAILPPKRLGIALLIVGCVLVAFS